MLLYEILDSRMTHTRKTVIKLPQKCMKMGTNSNNSYPMIEGRMSETLCLEVIDILTMMEYLQRAWKEYSELEPISRRHFEYLERWILG